jgi:1-acyl-sn-glycerol-3-phosphate acyltransferase
VPIERHRVDRMSANRLAALLEDGWSLVIFPEGGRSPDGWGQPHRAGAAWLAARTGRPVVPIHIEGTRRILPRGKGRLSPGRTQVTFGRPLRGGPSESRDLAARLERAVEALADEQATDWWTATRRAAQRASPSLTGPSAAAPWRRTWAVGADRNRWDHSSATRWPKP